MKKSMSLSDCLSKSKSNYLLATKREVDTNIVIKSYPSLDDKRIIALTASTGTGISILDVSSFEEFTNELKKYIKKNPQYTNIIFEYYNEYTIVSDTIHTVFFEIKKILNGSFKMKQYL